MITAEHRELGRCSVAEFTVSAQEGGMDLIERLAEEWRELCADAAQDQPFYRPEWIHAYLRAFDPKAKLVVVTARRADRMHLILPLVRESGWCNGIAVRMLRAPVNSHPGRFDAVRRSGAAGEEAVQAVWEFLERLPAWDLLECGYVPEESTISRIAGMARARRFPVAQIPLPANPFITVPAERELLNKLPANSRLRTKLRQVRRQLEEKSGLTLRRLDSLDRDALQRFYELEGRGWKGQEGSAILSDPRTRQFYDEIAEVAAHWKYLCLYLLEHDGQLLAAHFGLAHKGRYYSPKVAYDEALKALAPGHLIVSEIMNDCFERGLEEIDITGPRDEWKTKWTADARANSVCLIFARSMRGRLAHMLRFQVRPALARLVRRARDSE